MNHAFPITHVFTDIEGSTRLWEAHPTRMSAALARHDALAQQVVGENSGRVVKTTGDGIHAVFGDPLHALHAAIELQRAMHAIGQDAGVPLRIRCGIHAGVGEARDGDFYGTVVNRAARIMSSAHGGQMLVSQAVVELVSGRLAPDIALRDLGRVRLRDLATSERLYQVDPGATSGSFPPLRGLDAIPNNLPVLDSSFIGRVGTLAELDAAMSAHRLVTITGPGGMGKTRLALQGAADVLDRFDDGAWLVELAPVVDAALVPAAVARALAVTEEPGTPIERSIAGFVAGRNVLVILDNCEHVLQACAQFAEALLRAAPRIRFLATSREPMRIAGEQVFVLPPLALPTDPTANATEAARYPAVALFAERAREQSGRFLLTDRNAAAVVQICRRLDGLPLAIELAAARVRVLGVDDIARRLDDRFALLNQGRRTDAPRHRTLAALVGWSYELLAARERELFDRLSVFVGGFDLEAAHAIGVAEPMEPHDVLDAVASLVDKSLLVAEVNEDGTHARYRMLESLRAFAMTKLDERGEGAATRERHADYFGRLGHAQTDHIDAKVLGRLRAQMDVEHDNLRAALGFLLTRPGDDQKAAEFAISLTDFWHHSGHHREAALWLHAVLQLPFCAAPSRERARLLSEASLCAISELRFDDARRLAQKSLEDYRAHGSRSQVGAALQKLAEVEGRQGNFDASQRLFDECVEIFRADGNPLNVARIFYNMGTTYSLAGDFERARHYTSEAAASGLAAGRADLVAYAELGLGSIELELDRPVPARSHYERSRSLAQEIGDRFLETLARAAISQVDLAEGDFTRAHATAREVLDYFVKSGLGREITFVLDDIAHALAQRNEAATAARLFAAAAKHRAAAGVGLSETEQKRLDSRTSSVRSAVGAAIFDAAWKEGEALTLDAAVAIARATPLPIAAEQPPSVAAVPR